MGMSLSLGLDMGGPLVGKWGGAAPFPFALVSPLILLTGESNGCGFALNSQVPAGEAASRSVVKILNNTSLAFESLDVGTNNQIDQNVPDSATHGLEVGIANAADVGRLGSNQVYVVKAAWSGSKIADWATNGTPWAKLVARVDAAKAALAAVPYVPLVYYSQGINDATAGTSAATWKAATIAHIADIRSEIGPATPIYMTKFVGTGSVYNSTMDQIAAADPLVFVIDTTGLPKRTDGLDVSGFHWDYQGLLELAERFIDLAGARAGQLATPVVAAGVTISGPTVLRYSTDGTVPTSHSDLYTTPVTPPAVSREVRAVSIRQNFKNSAVGEYPFGWGEWVSPVGATTDARHVLTYGSGAASGARINQVIDATQQFEVVSDMPSQALSQGVITYLSTNATVDYSNTDVTAAVALIFQFNASLYDAVGGTIRGTATFPGLLRMKKSGNDLLYQISTDLGANWTTFYTKTGALTGQTILYVKSQFRVPAADQVLRVGIA